MRPFSLYPGVTFCMNLLLLIGVAAADDFLSEVRQITFRGRRAGEGYFQNDGRRLVFQSERQADNPFFQIYLLDLTTGDTQRISPGFGKTTCAWIHPDRRRVLFASTHLDPQARQKQKDELQQRAEGKERRYSWDYDEHYDLFVWEPDQKEVRRLTDTRGYDAEASWSPDGRHVIFASNRLAYSAELSQEEQTLLARDPSNFIDLFLLDQESGTIRQLTDTPGYDGGPFFSPDGQRICWRRFSENGALAEIMTMSRDGSDVRQLTRLGSMSWAPFYHPSGEYLIFTTNKHGFSNFELYLIDTLGKSQPVRVTDQEGFDGLPAFSPDGQQLSWTSNRNVAGQSQLYLAEWNHELALRRLGLDAADTRSTVTATPPSTAARASFDRSDGDFASQDIMRHVDYLCRPELGGRLTGTDGERRATEYVAAYMDHLGLEPAASNGTWFQEFEFTSGVSLGDKNELQRGQDAWQVEQDWRPLAFSANGPVEAAEIVFAGYGIWAPEEDGQPGYDSFVHLDVKDKWILALRDMPQEIPDPQRQQLARFSTLRYKAMQARDRGARGLIVVNGPASSFRKPLVPLRFDGSQSSSSLPVISIRTGVAETWLENAGKNLAQLQAQLDQGTPQVGCSIPGPGLRAQIEILQQKKMGRNVLGLLRASPTAQQAIVVGAHIDHLGTGASGSSLAREDEQDGIHFGADDNASGVAAMLEIAEHFARAQPQAAMQRNLLFAAWSGEELGLIGSSHFVKQRLAGAAHHHHAVPDPHAEPKGHPAAGLYPTISACVNLDMVGRLESKLVLQGVGSSDIWPQLIERRNVPVGLPLTLQNDSYLPTDASSFYVQSVPILSAFTGSHSDYHTPRDTPDKLNYPDAARIARLMGLIVRDLATQPDAPQFIAQKRAPEQRRARLRAYLGTIPDYAETDVQGLKLSGVAKGGPAATAGLRSGDVIVELAGKKIENIYDYTYAIEALKIGKQTTVKVKRGGQQLTLPLTPRSRD